MYPDLASAAVGRPGNEYIFKLAACGAHAVEELGNPPGGGLAVELDSVKLADRAPNDSNMIRRNITACEQGIDQCLHCLLGDGVLHVGFDNGGVVGVGVGSALRLTCDVGCGGGWERQFGLAFFDDFGLFLVGEGGVVERSGEAVEARFEGVEACVGCVGLVLELLLEVLVVVFDFAASIVVALVSVVECRGELVDFGG